MDETSAEEAQAAGESPDDDAQAVSQDISSSTSEDEEREDSSLPELSEMIQDRWRCSAPESGDVFEWIESEYRKSRGFELGTFDPSLKRHRDFAVILAEGEPPLPLLRMVYCVRTHHCPRGQSV